MKKKYIFIGILIIGLIFSILFSGKSLEMYINQDEDLSIIKTVSGICGILRECAWWPAV